MRKNAPLSIFAFFRKTKPASANKKTAQHYCCAVFFIKILRGYYLTSLFRNHQTLRATTQFSLQLNEINACCHVSYVQFYPLVFNGFKTLF